MSTSGDNTPEKMRARAFQLLEHAKSDPAYLQRLQDDPEAVLETEGFSSSEAGQLIGELGLAEVAGYLAAPTQDCQFTCNTGTCWVTQCTYIPVTNA